MSQQQRAISAVMQAIRRGDLPSLKDGEIPCTDCGDPAECYDHRDYSKPLEVEPVCQQCNVSRGAAVGWAGSPRLSIEMEESLITRGKMRALREGRSLTKLLNELLADYLNRVGEPEIKQ